MADEVLKPSPTREESTKQEYEYRVLLWIKALERKGKNEPSADDLIEYLESIKDSVKSATFRKYRSAAVYHFEKYGEQAKLYIDKLNSMSCGSKDAIPHRTSSTKRKSITEKEEQKILSELEKHINVAVPSWNRVIHSYFIANIIVGMRPAELPTAVLFKTQEIARLEGIDTDVYEGAFPMLRIENAKATNGRSFGKYRHVDVSAMDKKQLSHLEAIITIARKCLTPSGPAEDFDAFYEKFRKAWYQFMCRLDSRIRKITPYTLRHQSIADQKRTGRSLQEIAAMYGHGTDVTATEHYGKRRYGVSRTSLMAPNAKEVQKVRLVMTNNASPSPKLS